MLVSALLSFSRHVFEGGVSGDAVLEFALLLDGVLYEGLLGWFGTVLHEVLLDKEGRPAFFL